MQPAEVVSEALQAYLAKHRPAVAAFPVSATPSRRPRDVDEDNIMPSSAVKLRIMDSAQFFKKWANYCSLLHHIYFKHPMNACGLVSFEKPWNIANVY